MRRTINRGIIGLGLWLCCRESCYTKPVKRLTMHHLCYRNC